MIGKGKEQLAGLLDLTGKNGLLSGFNPYRVATPDKTSKAADPKNKYAEQLAKIEADRKKQNQAILNSQKKLTAEQKKQAALKKAGTIFDLEQINLIAALKGKLSDEERNRVLLQLALLTDNVTEAQRLTKEIALAQGLGIKLANDLSSIKPAANPFAAWSGYLDMIAAKANAIVVGGGGITNPNTPSTNVPPDGSLPRGGYGGGGVLHQGGGGSTGGGDIVVQIDGKTIATALQDQSMSGTNAYINRRTGGFE
jgi:hypothetical protein